MSKKTNEPSEWKAETERAERKQRLANLKNSEGGKKKITARSIGSRIAAIVIAVVLVLVVVVWGIARFGVLQKTLTAITIRNSELPGASMSLSPADLNVELGNLSIQAQLGYAFTDEIQDMLGRSSSGDRTLRDDLVDLTLEQIAPSYAMVLAMNNDDGFVLSEEKQAEIDKTIRDFEVNMAQSAQSQGVGAGKLLESYFGPGVSSQHYMKFVRQSLMLQEYNQYLAETTEATAAEIEEYKEEHAADLKIYSYSYYTLSLPATDDEEELTEDELETALQELNDDAAAALELYEKGELTFAEAMAEVETDENKLDSLKEKPEDLEYLTQGSSLGSSYQSWLTDEERKAGDTTVIKTSKSVIALVFHSAEFEDVYVYNVRHILIDSSAVSGEDGEPVADEKIKARAEEILAEFAAGTKTEEAFAELAGTYSSDTGSVDNGGLYENVAYGTMVKPFQDWSLDESRKAGDTGIVKSDYGYHIMYFVGLGDVKSIDYRVETLAKTEKINNWSQSLIAGSEIERHNLGMGFVGRKAFFKSLFAGDVTAAPSTSNDD
ncbi:MAG: hypothetical protein GX034_06105 [Clostridiaceae bacterium]|jgi:parvulin-like peptidyl-prolyl isomerase|nr:hypothetical protein [Clostridiaceae bacterium]